MPIMNAVVFVTGANRGLGAALVHEVRQRGAAKVYAATRTGQTIPGTVPVQLDITKPDQVTAAATLAADTTILINNAGVNFNAPLLNVPGDEFARKEMEVNYFGTLAMCRTFAPVLAANGGGTVVNISSVAGKVSIPVMGSLCASKAALVSLSQSIRAQLAKQNTRVILVTPGLIDTDMSRNVPMDKAKPADVARVILDAVEQNVEDVYPDSMAEYVSSQLLTDPKGIEKSFAAYVP